jgi:hypothetical protein
LPSVNNFGYFEKLSYGSVYLQLPFNVSRSLIVPAVSTSASEAKCQKADGQNRLGFRTPSGVGKSSMPEPRGSSAESYGESGLERGLGLTDAAQNRTHLRADRLDLDRKSGRRKADMPILVWRCPLMGSTDASVSASGRRAAPGVGVDEPCRVTAPVSRMRVMAVAALGVDSDVRTPR